jgi:hypothetical protein
LAEALRIIAPREIVVVEKEAKRNPKPNDKEDGLIPIGTGGAFSPKFTFRFISHKIEGYEGTEYAFDLDNIKREIQNGKSLILVANSLSNSELYRRLRSEFGDRMVHLFLWRFQSESELRQYQVENCSTMEEAEARIAQTEDIYKKYLENLIGVDFVMLNTSFFEDLHNQVFNLLSYNKIYGGNDGMQ